MTRVEGQWPPPSIHLLNDCNSIRKDLCQHDNLIAISSFTCFSHDFYPKIVLSVTANLVPFQTAFICLSPFSFAKSCNPHSRLLLFLTKCLTEKENPKTQCTGWNRGRGSPRPPHARLWTIRELPALNKTFHFVGLNFSLIDMLSIYWT